MELRKQASVNTPLEFAAEVNMNDDEPWLVTFLIQTKALLWKNYLVFFRKIQVILFILMTPVLCIRMLAAMRSIGDNLEHFGLVENAVTPLAGIFEKCNTGYRPSSIGYLAERFLGFDLETFIAGKDPQSDYSCTSVGYGIIGQNDEMYSPEYERYHQMMRVFADNVNFTYGSDVAPLTVGNQKTMLDYLDANQNKTQYAIMFCHEMWSEELEIANYRDIEPEELPNLTAEQNETLEEYSG